MIVPIVLPKGVSQNSDSDLGVAEIITYLPLNNSCDWSILNDTTIPFRCQEKWFLDKYSI